MKVLIPLMVPEAYKYFTKYLAKISCVSTENCYTNHLECARYNSAW